MKRNSRKQRGTNDARGRRGRQDAKRKAEYSLRERQSGEELVKQYPLRPLAYPFGEMEL